MWSPSDPSGVPAAGNPVSIIAAGSHGFASNYGAESGNFARF